MHSERVDLQRIMEPAVVSQDALSTPRAEDSE